MVLFLMLRHVYGQNGKVSPECTHTVTREGVAIPRPARSKLLVVQGSSLLSARASTCSISGSGLTTYLYIIQPSAYYRAPSAYASPTGTMRKAGRDGLQHGQHRSSDTPVLTSALSTPRISLDRP